MWEPVVGYEGFYEVSDRGEVRSLDRVVHDKTRRGEPRTRVIRGRVLRPGVRRRDGYRHVNLSVGGDKSSQLVHQLVARAFHGERPTDSPCVRHLDGDSTNNQASNLRYGTYSENAYDMGRHGTNPRLNNTHCPQGHPYSGDNLVLGTRPNGDKYRRCRTCRNTQGRDLYHRQRQGVGV